MSLGEFLGATSSTTLGLYRFENNTSDSSGNGANLTVAGSISYNVDAGKFNSSSYFNGASQFYRTSPFGTGNISFTYSGWFYVRSADASHTRGEIFMIGSSSITNGGIMFSVRPKSGGNCAIYMDYANVAGFSTNMRIIYNTWNHICVTKNANTIIVYLNGRSESFTKAGLNIGSGTQYFRLGDYGAGSAYFKGSMDEVFIENRVWSPEDVLKYYSMK